MFRKSLFSVLIAMALMALLAATVGAQTATDDEEPIAPSIVPMGGGIVQAIPLTLTVNVTDANGEIMTVEVPIVLSLDIQIALGNVLTTSVVVTPELVEVEPVAPITPTVAPTRVAAAPTRAAPTATPIPPTSTPAATPTQAAPTPAPVGQTQPEATEEPEEEPTAVPEEEATPEGEEEPTPEPVAAIDPDACSDPRSVISSPGAGEVVSGTVDVLGTARHELFNYYKLEYQQVGTETGDYAFIMDSANPVENGVLAELDSTELDNGAYVLRLTVVDNTGNFPPQCLVPVQIEN